MNSNFACFLVSKLTLLIAGVAMCSAQEAQPDNEIVEKPETLQQQMLGAWVLAGKPDAEIEPKPGARMKFIGLGYWLITQHNPKNGQVIFHHGGTYSLDGDRYVETIAFANKSTKQLIGVKSVFKIKIENEKLINIGQDNPFTELWYVLWSKKQTRLRLRLKRSHLLTTLTWFAKPIRSYALAAELQLIRFENTLLTTESLHQTT